MNETEENKMNENKKDKWNKYKEETNRKIQMEGPFFFLWLTTSCLLSIKVTFSYLSPLCY